MTKKTQKDLFIELRAIAETYGTAEQVEFLDKKIEQVSKKRTSAPTATQKANEVTKTIILDTLTSLGKAVTIAELQAENEDLGILSNQKISALLRQLKDTNQVIRTVDKKKAYFSVPLD